MRFISTLSFISAKCFCVRVIFKSIKRYWYMCDCMSSTASFGHLFVLGKYEIQSNHNKSSHKSQQVKSQVESQVTTSQESLYYFMLRVYLYTFPSLHRSLCMVCFPPCLYWIKRCCSSRRCWMREVRHLNRWWRKRMYCSHYQLDSNPANCINTLRYLHHIVC